ncbi:MAG TPA: hypothetical protein VJ794_03210 [Gemmatimonadales bacterium]|nr:hypothetical protein [Gemmatimonadales bacterium]
MTGSPLAIASSTTRPRVSVTDASTNASQLAFRTRMWVPWRSRPRLLAIASVVAVSV